jgi:hypothetical protein
VSDARKITKIVTSIDARKEHNALISEGQIWGIGVAQGPYANTVYIEIVDCSKNDTVLGCVKKITVENNGALPFDYEVNDKIIVVKSVLREYWTLFDNDEIHINENIYDRLVRMLSEKH